MRLRKWTNTALLCTTVPWLFPACAEALADPSPPSSSTERAVTWGETLDELCTRDFGLPEHSISADDASGASQPISAVQIDQLREQVRSYRAAQMYNHHGSGLARMRAAILTIDRATRATFGDTHLFATLSAACKVPLAGTSMLESDWNDDTIVNPIGESRADLARYIPDFIAVTDSGTNVIIEIKGQVTDSADAKAKAALRWVGGVNRLGTHGDWAYLLVTDPGRVAEDLNAYTGAKASDGPFELTAQ